MRNVYLLDCTLRDGGYINDFNFGKEIMQGFCSKIVKTGIEMLEVGFLKGDVNDEDSSLFPDVESFAEIIAPKNEKVKYLGMLDMSNPIPLERISPYDGTSIDGIRVIFKKNKIDEAYEYCKHIQELGYFISVNFVGTDQYSDEEFIAGINRFNQLNPFAMSIVDSFGLIKRKQFLHLCQLADANMAPDIVLAYHAHNNLQQAFGNAEALVEKQLERDLIIDACVFGMGRGAGNLNLELFAEYMNENYGTSYDVGPMLEIMDEYLTDIYKKKQWGYSLPFYLSASKHCHPNYAVYMENKDTLNVQDFDLLLDSISEEDKAFFSKDKAEKYYQSYLCKPFDDAAQLDKLKAALNGKTILMIAPGNSIVKYKQQIQEKTEVVRIAVNFMPVGYNVDYVFSNNMKRFRKIKTDSTTKTIVTSNVDADSDYKVSFEHFAVENGNLVDNSGVMLLRLLRGLGAKKVIIAGMDGYEESYSVSYYDQELEHKFAMDAKARNQAIKAEIDKIKEELDIEFMTPSIYQL
ncbi:MAG: aldolase catalytic domain-containing protein [Pseudobutyrivibrio sp.]|nr:aldolase catalytic domain-containing protein [Pseudobutyrivibrio sp.]